MQNSFTPPTLRRHKLGFLELAHKPTQQQLTEYYRDSYYQNESGNYRRSYSSLEYAIIHQRIQQRAHKIESLRGTASPGRLLDVGCGEGFALAHYAKLGWDVKGIDFSKAAIEQMNPTFAALAEQGDVFQLLATYIRADDSYDVVWLGNVLEHVLEPIKLLRSLRKLVTASGLLIITVPNDGTAYHENLYEAGIIQDRWWVSVPDHISYFTVESLRNAATSTGWKWLASQADFPIDWFLANRHSNYVSDRSRGPAAHEARLRLEKSIGDAGLDAASRFYESLADIGFGRNITAYLGACD